MLTLNIENMHSFVKLVRGDIKIEKYYTIINDYIIFLFTNIRYDLKITNLNSALALLNKFRLTVSLTFSLDKKNDAETFSRFVNWKK